MLLAKMFFASNEGRVQIPTHALPFFTPPLFFKPKRLSTHASLQNKEPRKRHIKEQTQKANQAKTNKENSLSEQLSLVSLLYWSPLDESDLINWLSDLSSRAEKEIKVGFISDSRSHRAESRGALQFMEKDAKRHESLIFICTDSSLGYLK